MVQIRMWCLRPYLEGCSPLPPSSPTRRPWDRGKGGRGLGKELMSSSLSVLLFWGPTGPSLTLASAPLTREHRGPPIPARHWLPCWSRSTGAPDDTAAQGWEMGPQLGARCLRSPSTCRPVRDTVCASFCREYLNTSRNGLCPWRISKSESYPVNAAFQEHLEGNMRFLWQRIPLAGFLQRELSG